MSMQQDVALAIRMEVEAFYQEYQNLEEDLCSKVISMEKWSLKEILGHLIDSASNNHQRIVRFQIEEALNFPDYHRDPWLAVGKYNTMAYREILELFLNFNRLISHLITQVKEEDLEKKWMVAWDPEKPYITLGELIPHYLDHLRIHFKHFKERMEEVEAHGE